jgi:hypothetical protein
MNSLPEPIKNRLHQNQIAGHPPQLISFFGRLWKLLGWLESANWICSFLAAVCGVFCRVRIPHGNYRAMWKFVFGKHLTKVTGGFSERISNNDLLLRNGPCEVATFDHSDIGLLATDFQRRFEAG